MSILIFCLIAIAGLFALMALFGLTQPRVVQLSRSILINAETDRVFGEISSLRNFVTWSPWSEKDPNMQQTFEGEDGTIGSVYRWKGNNKVGEGNMTITNVEPGKGLHMDLSFGNRGNAKCRFTAEKSGEATKMTWSFESDMGSNPMMRCAAPMMKKIIGRDYDAGLANLKRKIEA